MAQTAVEWLDRWFRDNPEATHEEGNNALKKAKQMEKEQICDAFDKGKWDTMAFKGTLKEQYYNETYGKE